MRYTPISNANIKAKAKLFKKSLAKTGRDISLTSCQQNIARTLNYSCWTELTQNIQTTGDHEVQTNYYFNLDRMNILSIGDITLKLALFLRIGLVPLNEAFHGYVRTIYMRTLNSMVFDDLTNPLDFTITTTNDQIDHLVSIDLAFERFSEITRQARFHHEMTMIRDFIDATVDSRRYISNPIKPAPAILHDMKKWIKRFDSDPFIEKTELTRTSIDNDPTAQTIASTLPRTGLVLIAGVTGSGRSTAANRIMHHLGRINRASTSVAVTFSPNIAFNNHQTTAYSLGPCFTILPHISLEDLITLSSKHLIILECFSKTINNIKTSPFEDFISNINALEISYVIERLHRNYKGSIRVKYDNSNIGWHVIEFQSA